MKQVPRPRRPFKVDPYIVLACAWSMACIGFFVTIGYSQPNTSSYRTLIVLAEPPFALPFLASSLIVAVWCRPLIRMGQGWLHIPIGVAITLLNVFLFSLLTFVSAFGSGMYALLVVFLTPVGWIVLGLGLASQLAMYRADKVVLKRV